MRDFMSDVSRGSLFRFCGCGILIDEYKVFTKSNGGSVLHRASRKIGDGHDVQLSEGILLRVVLVINPQNAFGGCKSVMSEGLLFGHRANADGYTVDAALATDKVADQHCH